MPLYKWKTTPRPPKGRILSDTQESRLSIKYRHGSSIADLIRNTGIGEKAISNALKRTHTKRRTKSQAQFLFYDSVAGKAKAQAHSLKIKKYSANEHFFSAPLNPISAYVLGFWIADGHIEKRNQNLLSFSQMEKEILLKIKHALHATNKIQYVRNKGYHLSISSKQLCEDIRNICRYSPAKTKSSTAKYPYIPRELDNHFIRGVFDGDGGIWIKNGQLQFALTGTEKLNKKIQIKLIKNCHVSKTKINIRGINLSFSQLKYTGNRQIPRIMNWLYEDAEIFLDRKKNFYDKFIIKYEKIHR